MQKRKLGRSGLEVSVLTMGCWQAGKSQWSNVTDEDSVAALRAAYDSGINFFDTAEGYGGGHSEKIVAESLKDVRDNVLIATKLGAGNMAKDKVAPACEASLERLQTDRIDLYQIHWPSGTWGSPVVPLEDTMGELLKLQEQGKIRAIGVSNFNSELIEEILKIGRIDSLQPPHSLFFRPYEFDGTFDTCQKHEIGIITYSSIAQGLLTGKFNQNNKPGEGDNRSGNVLFEGEHYERALAAVEDLKPVAEKYGVTLGQLAIRWVLAQPGITSAIVGARNGEQVNQNAQAANFEISPEDLAEIDHIGRTVTDRLPEQKTNLWA
jgi:aryl-alcohol dehydrogenase-like predicted oxidoreductase